MNKIKLLFQEKQLIKGQARALWQNKWQIINRLLRFQISLKKLLKLIVILLAFILVIKILTWKKELDLLDPYCVSFGEWEYLEPMIYFKRSAAFYFVEKNSQ